MDNIGHKLTVEIAHSDLNITHFLFVQHLNKQCAYSWLISYKVYIKVVL